jgi:diguanylate cyclase (GGDEF)-like protein/PAS domain S-box-containing protein
LLHALTAVTGNGQPLIRDEQPLLLTGALEPLYADLRAVAVRGGVALSFRDVSERRQASQRLAASEQRFRLLAENVTDVVFLCERGRLSWIAPGLNRALGWLPDDWLGQRLQQLCHPEDQARLTGQVDQVEQGEQINLRVRVQDSEGRWRWLEIHAGPYCSAEGQQLGVVGALHVVDEVVAAEAELNRRARIDSLTGLLNRQEILERLDWLNQRRRQGDKALAVLFCDVDHFKEINDRHGHGGGDAVLQALAGQLRACTRVEDLVGRLGGDELLVVLQGMASLKAAEGLAAKIHAAVQKPLTLPTGVVVPTLSIGVTLLQPEESVDAVVDRADQAMYAGKLLGRNRVIAFG